MPPPDPNSAANKSLARAILVAEEQAARARSSIASHASIVAGIAIRLGRAAEAPESFFPNSLGELQGSASTLDAYCGKYSGIMDVLSYLRSLAATEGTVDSPVPS